MTLDTMPPAATLARDVASILAANPALSAFFGSSIGTAGDEESRALPIPAPGLLIVPGQARPVRRCGGKYSLSVPIEIRAVLPRVTPASNFIATPSAPAVSSAGTTYYYRITQWGTLGESYASAATGASAICTLTLPALAAGATGFRIWRSASGKTACKWIATVRTAGSWTDSSSYAQGDELAPIMGMGDAILGMVETVLYSGDDDHEYLPWAGDSAYHADAGLVTQREPPRLAADRNLSVYTLLATYQTVYDPATQLLRVGSL